jgi:hypothetical protein
MTKDGDLGFYKTNQPAHFHETT